MSRISNMLKKEENNIQQPQPIQSEPVMPMNQEESETVFTSKQLKIFLVIIAVLYVVLSLPVTFSFVGKLIQPEWVSSNINTCLDNKLVFVHGIVFLLLAYGLTLLIKNGTFDNILN